MIKLQRVLVPTDFSDSSEAALKYGRAFARAFHASFYLLHIIQDPYTQPWAAEAFPAPLNDLLDQWQTQARTRLLESLTETDRAAAIVDVRIGSPYVEIVRYAEEQQIDLIVLGTHGRGPLGHVLLGSVAEKVVRKAPCPVLTVRSAQHEFLEGE
jgi:universal stress protein A